MDNNFALSNRSLQYYVIAKRWSSDLEFYNFELDFLVGLLKSNITRQSDQLYQHSLKNMLDGLHCITDTVLQTDVLLQKQLKQLEMMAEGILPEDIPELAKLQIKLDQLMVDVTGDFRELKKSIFKLVESAIFKS
jgi:hypothetical protein